MTYKSKTLLILVCLILCSSASYAKGRKDTPIYKNANVAIEDRVEDLLSRMTLEEKVMQLNQYTLGRNNNVNNVEDEVKEVSAQIGSLIYFDSNPVLRNRAQRKAMEESRLGIPILFAHDVIHGFRTVYPISLAQACSWNTELVKQACAVAAQESRMSGIEWTFSPMIDVARDGRWGRVAEGYGEDPYTNAVFGVVSVQGYQGEDLSASTSVAACLKHYVGYGASEAGRDYMYTEISQQTLWDTYLLPYEEGIKAGAATVMSCFNDISGTPGTANPYILTEILKERWKHPGFVVSDWGAIQQLRSQGVAADHKEAAQKAFIAGVEMDMMNGCYDNHLATLVEEGSVPMSLVDESVRRVLRVKFQLGLFDNPYTEETPDEARLLLPENVRIAQQLAEESMVLLKNENQTLPLKTASKIAVIGPMVKEKDNLLGSWYGHGRGRDVESIYEGLEKEFAGKSQLLYAKGCDFEGDDKTGFAEAGTIAEKADILLICLGEKRSWSGENASRSTLSLPTIQEELVKELHKLGKPIVLILSSGRPLELCRLEPISNAILEIWQPGIAGGTPLAGILSGRINPSGKLSITFPYSTGQVPIYYNHRQSARTNQGKYQDIPSTALYEFAHGLSYTTFEYGELRSSTHTIKRGEKFVVEIPITNTGEMDGSETIHWFIRDPVCTISRPVKELKFFEKQQIRKGETKTFRFEIDPVKDLSFVNDKGERFLEAGEYQVIVKDQIVKVELVD